MISIFIFYRKIMSSASVVDIQEEFADLDLDITDGDVLLKIKVWIKENKLEILKFTDSLIFYFKLHQI